MATYLRPMVLGSQSKRTVASSAICSPNKDPQAIRILYHHPRDPSCPSILCHSPRLRAPPSLPCASRSLLPSPPRSRRPSSRPLVQCSLTSPGSRKQSDDRLHRSTDGWLGVVSSTTWRPGADPWLDLHLFDEEELSETAGHGWDEESPASSVRQKLLELDPGLNQGLISSGTSISQLFTQDSWSQHRNPFRYFTNMATIPVSTVFRRILQPCLVLTALAAAVCAYNSLAGQRAAWPRLVIPAVCHTLLGAAISLQLVFRTNGSYARFLDGRQLWGSIVRLARDWARNTAIHFPRGKGRAMAAAYIQALAFLAKAHLRSGRTREDPNNPTAYRDDPTAVINSLLDPVEAADVLTAKNPTFYMLCKMTLLVKEADGLDNPCKERLEKTIADLGGAIGGCERLLSTPMPLSYTRHTSRSLTVWLASLPFALYSSLGWLTVPSMLAVCFIFLGIDEIGIQIEEPFCVLPLLPLCQLIVRDVRIASAFGEGMSHTIKRVTVDG